MTQPEPPCKGRDEWTLGSNRGNDTATHLDAAEARQREESQLRARLACFTCPIRRLCLDREMEHDYEDQWFIYGGYTGAERRRILQPERRGPLNVPKKSYATPAYTTKVVAAFLAGKSCDELGVEFNRAPNTIRQILWAALWQARLQEDSDLLVRVQSPETQESVHAA